MNNIENTHGKCPICHGINTAYVNKHSNFSLIDIWVCNNCKHWFSCPEPNEEDLNKYYRETYRSSRSKLFTEEYYLIMEKRARAQIQFMQQSLNTVYPQDTLQGWKAIDWGCGIGALVLSLQQTGVDAVGYDSDISAIDTGRKRWADAYLLSRCEDLTVFREKFDLLLLSHVIEHLPDIEASLKNILQVLKPNGYLFIEVPNCCPEMISTSEGHESHLHFFSMQSLLKLLNNLGIKGINCVSCGPMQNFDIQFSDSQRPFAVKVKHKLENILIKLKLMNMKTMYDGFYEYYSKNDDRLWLRYFGQKQMTS